MRPTVVAGCGDYDRGVDGIRIHAGLIVVVHGDCQTKSV